MGHNAPAPTDDGAPGPSQPKERAVADTAEILSVITQIVAEEAALAPEAVTRDSRFAQDLDIDSLGLLTTATQVEERLDVTLDDSLIPTLPTVGALVDLVSAQRA